MPRIAERRPPAVPSSGGQRDRQRRILRAAARLGSQHGLERVQMHEVAKEAGVAIATLYRYFPSKTHLFVGVMGQHVDHFQGVVAKPRPDQSAAEAVADLLVAGSHQLLKRPRLALAMMQANNAALSAGASDAPRVAATMQDLILRVAGIDEPSDDDEGLVRLLEQCWYGALISTLNGLCTLEEMERDIRRACELILVSDSASVAAPAT